MEKIKENNENPGKELRERYPLFDHPEFFISQLENDRYLFNRVVARFNQIKPFRAQRLGYYYRVKDGKSKKAVHIPAGLKASQLNGNQFKLKDLEDHFYGYKTMGLKFRPGNKFVKNDKEKEQTLTRWICFDIDLGDDIKLAEKITKILYKTINQYIAAYISNSGKKGFHIESFTSSPVTSKDVALFRDAIVNESGIAALLNPKQLKTLDGKDLVECYPKRTGGNGTKFSMGVNMETGLFCGWMQLVNDQLIPIEKPYHYFIDIPEDDPSKLVDLANIEEQRQFAVELQNKGKKRAKEKNSKGQDSSNREGAKTQSCIEGFGTIQGTIDHIKKNGLLRFDSGYRHETTFFYARWLINNGYSKDEIKEILLDWSKEVLYPKCGEVMTTPIDEHIVETMGMVDFLKESVLEDTLMQVPISKLQFEYMINLCKTKGSVNLKKLHVLIGLCTYPQFKIIHHNFAQKKGKKDAFQFAQPTPKGYLFYASKRHLSMLLNTSHNTISKYIDELDCMDVVSIGNGGYEKVLADRKTLPQEEWGSLSNKQKWEIKKQRVEEHKRLNEEKWEMSQYHIIMPSTGEMMRDDYYVQRSELRSKTLSYALFHFFYTENEIKAIVNGDKRHFHTVKKVLDFKKDSEIGA